MSSVTRSTDGCNRAKLEEIENEKDYSCDVGSGFSLRESQTEINPPLYL